MLLETFDKITGKDAEKIRAVERALLVYSEFTNTSDKHKVLYGFLENSGIGLALSLRLHYRKFLVLTDRNADAENFCESLEALGSESKVECIDVIMHMHGAKNKMFFNNTKNTDELQEEIAALRLSDKLRMFYTTACFGRSHAQDMVQAGFTCAAGANGVNANSATEYPEFISRWMGHEPFQQCIERSFNARVSRALEQKAKNMGFSDVDSRKTIHGDGSTTIISPPR